MGRNEWTALGLLAAAFLGGAALAGPGSQFAWFLARASGLAAFAALTASMVLGLLVTTKVSEPKVPRIFNFEIHSFVSVLALTLIGIHGGSLLFDASFHFTPLALLVPFVAPYAPLWTGLGVIAAWLVAVVTGSFWAKKRIGHKAWRKLHYASFGAYALSLVHGMSAGSDTSNVAVYWFYALSVTLVASLFVLRLAGPRKAAAPHRAAPANASTATGSRPAPAVVSVRREPRPAAARSGSQRVYQSRSQQRVTRSGPNCVLAVSAGAIAAAGILAGVVLSGPNVGTTVASVGSSLSHIAPSRTSRGS
jgi:methionine sulfoxide reductase heme-binding subunit